MLLAHRVQYAPTLVGCGGRIVSSDVRSGIITSPLYPKPYPADRSCHFVFEGRSDERIQIRFNDFQLYYSYEDPNEPHEYATLRLSLAFIIEFVAFNCNSPTLSAIKRRSAAFDFMAEGVATPQISPKTHRGSGNGNAC